MSSKRKVHSACCKPDDSSVAGHTDVKGNVVAVPSVGEEVIELKTDKPLKKKTKMCREFSPEIEILYVEAGRVEREVEVVRVERKSNSEKEIEVLQVIPGKPSTFGSDNSVDSSKEVCIIDDEVKNRKEGDDHVAVRKLT